jgi:hypothetical protein
MARLLDTISRELLAMCEKFEKNEIPHPEGHAIDKILNSSQLDLERALHRDAMASLWKLNDLVLRAKEIDGAYLGEYHEGERQTVSGWIVEAQRLAGDYKGIAAVLLTKA